MKQETNFYLLTFCKTIFFAMITFLAPIKGLLLITGLCVLLDTFFAIYTTIKLNGWASYQSTKLFNIVVKSFFYLGSIILAFFVDTHIIEKNTLFGVNLLVSKVVTIFWIYIEVKSIDETSQKLGNKSFYFTIKNLLTKLKDLKKDINEIKE
jgi:hypothetical protein